MLAYILISQQISDRLIVNDKPVMVCINIETWTKWRHVSENNYIFLKNTKWAFWLKNSLYVVFNIANDNNLVLVEARAW